MPYIKVVHAKGREYLYFDTGFISSRGTKVLKRLPARNDVRNFGSTYSALLAQRTKMENRTPLMTMRDLSREYQLSKKFTKRSRNTQDTYFVYLRQIEDEMGDAPLTSVERKDVQELMDQMQERPGAAKMLLLLLRNLFNHAIAREWVKLNPAQHVDPPESEDDGDHLPWPEDLIDEAIADPQIGLPIALLYYTGQRIGDVCGMAWEHIQDDETIYVCQEKTGKEVWPPLHSTLKSILDRTPRTAPTILHGPKNRPRRRETLRQQVKAWLRARGHDFVPHGLRKNAVIALLDADCTLVEVSAITGQSLKVVEEYAKRRNTRGQGHRAMRKWDRGTDAENRKPEENLC